MRHPHSRHIGRRDVPRCIRAASAPLALLAALLCAGGCTSTRYVPVETVRTQTEEVTRWRTDTVTQGDTRIIYIKGDTVIDRRDRWRDRITQVHDTLYIERTDSVAVPYPVERELTRWERAKVDWGGWAMAAAAAAIAMALWRIKNKLHKI